MKRTLLCLFLVVCLVGSTVDAHRRRGGFGLRNIAGAYLGAHLLSSAFRPHYYPYNYGRNYHYNYYRPRPYYNHFNRYDYGYPYACKYRYAINILV